MKKTIFLIVLWTACYFPLFSFSVQAVDVTIGTGGTQGVYYPTGWNICSMVNSKPEYGINCSAISTGGSTFNINSVLDGTLEFGIAQSDRQYEAWYGLGWWQGVGSQEKLRSIFSIHYEAVYLISGADTGINTLEGLIGKVVDIGFSTSSRYKNAIDVLNNTGIDYTTDLTATQYTTTEAINRFQNSEIDALFITIGYPTDLIVNITEGSRQVYIVPITNLDPLIDSSPYYVETIIPIKYYPKATNTQDVVTLGLKATFLTSVDISDDIVYAFTKEIFDNHSSFKQLHPAYESLTWIWLSCGAGSLRTAILYISSFTVVFSRSHSQR